MYSNLVEALHAKRITIRSYAEFLDVTDKTARNKINGLTEFTYKEVEKTCRILFPEYNMEYLFTPDEETKGA